MRGAQEEEAFPARAVGLRRQKLTADLPPPPRNTATARPGDSSPRGQSHRGMGRAWSGVVLVFVFVPGFSANSVVAARGGHTLLGKVRFVLVLVRSSSSALSLLLFCFAFFVYSVLCSIDSSANETSEHCPRHSKRNYRCFRLLRFVRARVLASLSLLLPLLLPLLTNRVCSDI